jgi:tRNA threonylcarbamoyladenosine biosynthesis protein TsaE
MIRLRLDGVDATMALGAELGRRAVPGTVIALVGDLGAGKTVVARGVGEGLGVVSRVQSPTFVIVQTHHGGRLPYWHADLYRVGDESELDHLGLAEVLYGEGVAVVEWADRFPSALPDDRLEIVLEGDGDERIATLVALGARHRSLIEAWPP